MGSRIDDHAPGLSSPHHGTRIDDIRWVRLDRQGFSSQRRLIDRELAARNPGVGRYDIAESYGDDISGHDLLSLLCPPFPVA